MKGIVFSEFLEMIENQFSLNLHHQVLRECQFDHDGVYTPVGTYPYEEFLAMADVVSRETNIDQQKLIHVYGEYLFSRFVELYPEFFENMEHPFDFLESVDKRIRPSMNQVYPDADFPALPCRRLDEKALEIQYKSVGPLMELAYGLVQATLEYFRYESSIEVDDKSTTGDHTDVTFTIRLE